VVVLDADSASRVRAEQVLRQEEYWAIGTDDPRTVLRLVRVAAADLVAVDLGMGALEAVPRWQRRQADLLPRERPPLHGDGYAILRPLQADPSCARFPLVVLRPEPPSPEGRSRFGIVDYVPKAAQGGDFLEKVDAVFRDVVGSARRREQQLASAVEHADPAPAPHDREAGPALGIHARPFENVPKALRSALLVDPDVTYRRFIQSTLVRCGFTVHEAATSAEGLALAIARRPWLILSEVNLPDESGFEFCSRVRQSRLLRRTPLVFLSDWDDYDRRYVGLRRGADDYLTKPVPLRELLIRLQLVLRRYAEIQTESPQGSRLQGTMDLVGALDVLQMCHLSRLTGVLTAANGSQICRITFRNGEIVAAAAGALRGVDAVCEFVAWSQGSFGFTSGDRVEGAPVDASFDVLLLEGCRRLDERRRDRPSESTRS
jgi:DNA-binding response OmpR family regulator